MKWISVKDRLPPEKARNEYGYGEHYLVAFEDGDVMELEWTNRYAYKKNNLLYKFCFMGDCCSDPSPATEVTHWMPLPEKPG